jgi:hypothetical protein
LSSTFAPKTIEEPIVAASCVPTGFQSTLPIAFCTVLCFYTFALLAERVTWSRRCCGARADDRERHENVVAADCSRPGRDGARGYAPPDALASEAPVAAEHWWQQR